MKLIIVITLSLLMFASTATAETNKRQAIKLSETQRNHIQKEMRAWLSGVQNILAALSMDNMEAAAKHARPLGMNMGHKPEEHLKAVLPKGFMQLGMSVHQDFDQIATDAESKKDPKLSLRQLSNAMTKCVACHTAYQVHTTIEPPNYDDHDKH